MIKTQFLIMMLLTASLTGCKNGNPIWQTCTDEFRFIALTVSGPALTDFYTVRLSTSDTIRVNGDIINGKNQYVVLNDLHRLMFEGRQEEFLFIGLRGDTIAVSEAYLIRADRCHIEKVSGKEAI
ncbi:hypothetical protein [Dyadobacter sp. MSC1_007]|jgi:hypothetical protein|uniref:hypothetical protein n=1 Tax=Dyadobacter sp. MSC1_007 TaxID=2909264 RepID=UPI00202FDCA8|nr:hypothetical protein [Dyadobacter sp. MSC1_007]